MKVEGLIFDCDGTLVDTLPIYRAAWGKVFQPFGKPVSHEWLKQRKGLPAKKTLQDFAIEFGRPIDQEAMMQDLHIHFLEGLKNLQEFSAIASIVRQYHGQIPMAVASSGLRHFVEPSLKITQLYDYFNCLVTVEEIQHPKPAPDIFLESARQLEVNPQHCIVFEDSKEGFEAAHQAGMLAIDATQLQKENSIFSLMSLQAH